MLPLSTGRYIPPHLRNKDASKNGEWGQIKAVLWSFPVNKKTSKLMFPFSFIPLKLIL